MSGVNVWFVVIDAKREQREAGHCSAVGTGTIRTV
jgi:hypothetical protein